MYSTKEHFSTTVITLVASLVIAKCAIAQNTTTHSFKHSERSTLTIEQSEGKVTPADNYVLAAFVLDELGIIQDEMGKPKNKQHVLHAHNATPHAVFFQSLTLYRKADELCYEITRNRTPEIEIPTKNIRPEDVKHTLELTLARLDLVKKKLGITRLSEKQIRNDAKQACNVFRIIVQANRQLNLLLSRKFDPSDVFQQVTLAVNYSARLLSQFPGSTRIPDTPTYQRCKHPIHVYKRLLDCYGSLRQIAKLSGFDALELQVDQSDLGMITPSDVYDIASVIVSDLAFLHKHVTGIEPPARAYYSGRKLPSDVFQRAGILEAQLVELLNHVKESPDWLK